MSITDLNNYYSNLLIKQYFGLPNAVGTIQAISNELQADLVYTQVRDSFNLATAQGDQLLIIAKYIGVEATYDGTYFYYNGNQFNAGDFGVLLKIKLIQNSCNQTMGAITSYLWEFFGNRIHVVDNQDMTLTYEFSVTDLPLMTFAKSVDILPRPMGVGLILEAIVNPNGEFGYSMGGVVNNPVGSFIAGYGDNIDSHTGGTMLFVGGQ